MTPTQRLTTALRGLADVLEGPLPSHRDDRIAAAADIALLLDVAVRGTDPLDALCDAGLCDE